MSKMLSLNLQIPPFLRTTRGWQVGSKIMDGKSLWHSFCFSLHVTLLLLFSLCAYRQFKTHLEKTSWRYLWSKTMMCFDNDIQLDFRLCVCVYHHPPGGTMTMLYCMSAGNWSSDLLLVLEENSRLLTESDGLFPLSHHVHSLILTVEFTEVIDTDVDH